MRDALKAQSAQIQKASTRVEAVEPEAGLGR